jgi:chromosome segregation ATPase
MSRNRGQGALAGALVGLVVGGIAGTMVANRNYTFANREASAQNRIESATKTADALEQQSRSAQQVVDQNRRTLADLDRQYRNRQISAAEYNARAEPMRADLQQMREGARNGAEAREQINRVAGDLPQLRAQESRMGPAQRRLEGSANELDDLLRRVPAA